MNSIMAVEIKPTLERQFELFLTPQEIKNMTFEKLLKIETPVDKNENDEVEQTPVYNILDQKLNYLMQATENKCNLIVRILLLSEDRYTIGQPNINECTLFVMPGIEGIAPMMEPLSKNLNMQVFYLRHDIVSVISTIEQMATCYPVRKN